MMGTALHLFPTSGDVMPSGLLPIKLGNVRNQPLKEIYRESPILKDIRNPDRSIKESVEFVNTGMYAACSRSRTYAVTGDYMESEPFCVYIPKAMRK